MKEKHVTQSGTLNHTQLDGCRAGKATERCMEAVAVSLCRALTDCGVVMGECRGSESLERASYREGAGQSEDILGACFAGNTPTTLYDTP